MATRKNKQSPVRDDHDLGLTERAYRLIEEAIVTLKLPPGSITSEASLSEKFGIGRMPVREALQRLARERLVQIMPRRGVIVTEINVLAQIRLVEVRRELERLLARSAARRANPEHRELFRAIATGMMRAAADEDDLLFMQQDRAFNALLLEAARNEFAASAMGLMTGLSRRFWYRHYNQVSDLPQAALLHAEIASAIAEGDEAKAVEATDRLLDYIENVIRATVSADT